MTSNDGEIQQYPNDDGISSPSVVRDFYRVKWTATSNSVAGRMGKQSDRRIISS
jgi:hypothetical protein